MTPLPRMTTRRWMIAVAVAAVISAMITFTIRGPVGTLAFAIAVGLALLPGLLRFYGRTFIAAAVAVAVENRRTLIAAALAVAVEIGVFKFLIGFNEYGYHPAYGLLDVTALAGAALVFLAPVVLLRLCWIADHEGTRLPRLTFRRVTLIVAMPVFVIGSARLVDRNIEEHRDRSPPPVPRMTIAPNTGSNPGGLSHRFGESPPDPPAPE